MAYLQSGRKSVDLDAMRWIAAALVLYGHAAGFLLPSHPAGVLPKAIGTVSAFPHQAVVVFFVISGYLVGGGAVRKARRGEFGFRLYFGDRFSRIYTVLVPTLLAVVVLDSVGRAFFNESGIYSGASAARLNVATFLGNALNLQQVWAPVFGSDSPLWTLAFEWWCYIVFGIGCWVVSRRLPVWLRVILTGLLVTATVAVMPVQFRTYALIWLMGTLVAVVPGKPRNVALTVAAFVATIAVAVLVRGSTSELLSLALAVPFSAFLFTKARFDVLRSPVHVRMANFSYTTYLVHYPLIVFFTAFAADRLGVTRSSTSPYLMQAALFGAAVVGIFGVAWLFSLVTERQTPRVRKVVVGLLMRPARPAEVRG